MELESGDMNTGGIKPLILSENSDIDLCLRTTIILVYKNLHISIENPSYTFNLKLTFKHKYNT